MWLIAFLLGGIIYYYRLQATRRERMVVLEPLAEKTGLEVVPINSFSFFRTASLSGEYLGREVEFSTFEKNRATWIQIDIAVENESNIYMTMRAEGAKSYLQSYGSSFKTGDDRFDKQFYVEGEPDYLINKILGSSTLRARLLKATWRGYVRIEAMGEQIKYEQPFLASREVEYLQQLIDLVSDLAEVFEEVSEKSAI